MESLKEKVKSQIEIEGREAIDAIQILAARYTGMAEFQSLTSEDQARLQEPFAKLEKEIQQQKLIAVIRDRLRSFQQGEYTKLQAELSSVNASAQKKKEDLLQREKQFEFALAVIGAFNTALEKPGATTSTALSFLRGFLA